MVRTGYEDIWRRTAAVSALPGRRPSALVRAVERPQASSPVSEQQSQRREAEHGFLLRQIAGDGRCCNLCLPSFDSNDASCMLYAVAFSMVRIDCGWLSVQVYVPGTSAGSLPHTYRHADHTGQGDGACG